MKRIKYYIMLAMGMLLAGCSQDELPIEIPGTEGLGKKVEITLGVPDGDRSRVSYEDGSTTPFSWESGDAIVAVGFGSDGTYKGVSEFTMLGEVGNGKNARFEGRLVNGAESYQVYYKAAKLSLSNGIPNIDYSTQTEDLNNPTAHMRDYYLLGLSQPVPQNRLLSGGNSLMLLNSLFRLDVKSLPGDMGTLKSIKLFSNTNKPTDFEQTKLAVSNTSAQTGGFTAYMMFNPELMAQHSGNDFKIIFEGNKSYSVEGKNSKETFCTPGVRYNLIAYQQPEELEEGKKGLNNWTEFVPVTINPSLHTVTTLVTGEITMDFIRQALNGENELKVEGPINGTDIKAIREATGCVFDPNVQAPGSVPAIVTRLDLSKATLVAGGAAYAKSFGEFMGGAENTDMFLEDYTVSPFMFSTSRLTALTLPESTKKISNAAFALASELKALTLPNELTDITLCAFAMSSIKELTIPEKTVNWNYGTFAFANELEKIHIKAPIKTIPEYCFQDCNALKSIIIPNTVETIGKCAFQASGLTALVIPKEVQIINPAFIAGCQSLTSLTIAGKKGETTIHQEAFTGFDASVNCNLTLHASWTADITTAPDGTQKFMGVPFKSIKILQDSSVGFDGVTDEDML